MLRIRFDEKGAVVYYNDGKDNGFEAKETYDKVEFEVQDSGFWHRIPEPLKAAKASLLVLALAKLLSEGKMAAGGESG